MSRPSKVESAGSEAPASFAKVGKMSIEAATSLETRPAGMRSGHQAMSGTRIPPSQVLPFMPRKTAGRNRPTRDRCRK